MVCKSVRSWVSLHRSIPSCQEVRKNRLLLENFELETDVTLHDTIVWPRPLSCLSLCSTVVWRSSRKKANPAKKEDVVDLGSKFGMNFGSDSDSSDAEFAPENETIDSDGMIEEDTYCAWCGWLSDQEIVIKFLILELWRSLLCVYVCIFYLFVVEAYNKIFVIHTMYKDNFLTRYCQHPSFSDVAFQHSMPKAGIESGVEAKAILSNGQWCANTSSPVNPDSHEFLGDDENTSNQAERTTTAAASKNTTAESQDSDQDESMETQTTSEIAAGEREVGKENGEEVEQEMETADAEGASGGEEGEGEGKEEGGEKAKPQEKEEQEYNPLIVRRSNRAIKPTKDVDLYLLGAQFGIDVEGSDADSSDQEFAPAAESDREFQYLILMPILKTFSFILLSTGHLGISMFCPQYYCPWGFLFSVIV